MTDGPIAPSVQIGTQHLTARIHPFGASLCDLRLAGHAYPLIHVYDDEALPRQRNFAGAVIGRFANRIAHGSATLAGDTLSLERNDNGINALHGGTRGFAARWWTIENTTANAVTLRLRSPDGDAGYPGTLDVRVIYRVEAPATLTLEVMATTDAPTLVNICHHPYFTFDGAQTVSAHILWIDADRYLTADASLVPINPVPVAGTPFDFRRPRPVGDEGTQFNNTYCIGTAPWQHLRKVARLSAGGIEMALSTTQPGLHFYDGYKVTASNEPACGAQALGPRSALCLEAQGWPDAPNRPDFPSAMLERRQIYRHRTEYAFSRLG